MASVVASVNQLSGLINRINVNKNLRYVAPRISKSGLDKRLKLAIVTVSSVCFFISTTQLTLANKTFEHVDVVVDQLIAIVSNSILDSRSYYWPHFVEPRFTYHEIQICFLFPATNTNSQEIIMYHHLVNLYW